MKWLESVPNFSEGKNPDVVEKIVKCADKYDRVWIVNYSMDKDHNRSVAASWAAALPLHSGRSSG